MAYLFPCQALNSKLLQKGGCFPNKHEKTSEKGKKQTQNTSQLLKPLESSKSSTAERTGLKLSHFQMGMQL